MKNILSNCPLDFYQNFSETAENKTKSLIYCPHVNETLLIYLCIWQTVQMYIFTNSIRPINFFLKNWKDLVKCLYIHCIQHY